MPYSDEHGPLLFVSGLPQSGPYSRSRHWKKRLKKIFLRLRHVNLGRIKLGVNSDNHLKGFCWIGLKHAKSGPDSNDAASKKHQLERLIGSIRIESLEEYDVSQEETLAKTATPHDSSRHSCDISTLLSLPQARTQITLQVSRQTDRRDMLFPYLSEAGRSKLQFDTVAFFSCCDAHSADRITRILSTIGHIGLTSALNQGFYTSGSLHILDAFGCVGGNATSFARENTIETVSTVEMDPDRYRMLVNNVNVALPQNLSSRVNCLHGDSYNRIKSIPANVLFLDPPWGGTDYNSSPEKLSDLNFYPACKTLEADKASNDAAKAAPVSCESQCHTLRDTIILAGESRMDLIAIRLPRNFDVDALARWCVSTERKLDGLVGDKGGINNDRPLPFQMKIGHKAILFVLALPQSRTLGEAVRLSYGLHNLDQTIHAIRTLNQNYLQELHPKFYDWEANRWIRLNIWKGVKP